MNITLIDSSDNINWQQVRDVLEKAPLNIRTPEEAQTAFSNSQEVCFAIDDGEIIGCARALSDGIAQAVIYDLAILPRYQGTGLGRRIMENLCERLKGQTIILFAVPAKKGFYAKLGFKDMKTAMAKFSNEDRMEAQGYI